MTIKQSSPALLRSSPNWRNRYVSNSLHISSSEVSASEGSLCGHLKGKYEVVEIKNTQELQWCKRCIQCAASWAPAALYTLIRLEETPDAT